MWINDAVFYHVYPLGSCDAPHRNDFSAAPVPRLRSLHEWVDHWCELGVNALYLGPLFESTAHGYDTVDYFKVDRRLGDNDTLKALAIHLKQNGMRLVLDAVFNHVGRDFWAFKDVQQHREQSRYRDWFHGMDFSRDNGHGDGFAYEGWAGHYDLVKLNTWNPEVRQHLFDAVSLWVREFDIDGLRLDAADVIEHDFLRALTAHCRALKPDFWLMGEVVHGDYRHWAHDGMLDATTNYECYKGLYSSHVDSNYFEIAYSLNRQFGEHGIYKHLTLYNFVDNHDVNRVASNLTNQAHLYPLYGLMFTMPGVPSIYYGSEWGIAGSRTATSDRDLRPRLYRHEVGGLPHPHLYYAIQRFSSLRHTLPALRYGGYRQLHVESEQFAFMRETADERVIVALNAADEPKPMTLQGLDGAKLYDELNHGDVFEIKAGQAAFTIPPNWLRVMIVT